MDTPVDEALQFLATLLKVEIEVDPEATGEARKSITLKIVDMTSGNALKWVTRLANLDYVVKDNAVYISTQDKVKAVRQRSVASPLGTTPSGENFERNWRDEIRRKLRTYISFPFGETPLEESIQIIRSETKCNIIHDPMAVGHPLC